MASSAARTNARPPPLLQGTLDMMILQTLIAGAQHGYGVASRIRQTSGEVLTVEEGSLYPALHRLEKRGHVESEWRRSDSNRRAKYYQLTASGRKHLRSEVETWRSMSEAIGRVIGFTRHGLDDEVALA